MSTLTRDGRLARMHRAARGAGVEVERVKARLVLRRADLGRRWEVACSGGTTMTVSSYVADVLDARTVVGDASVERLIGRLAQLEQEEKS